IAANRVRRDDDDAESLKRGPDDALHQVNTDAGRVTVPDAVVQRKDERDWRRGRIAGWNGDRVADPAFARTYQRPFMQARSKHEGIIWPRGGGAKRKHKQKRERNDRKKGKNQWKWDTSKSAVT